MKLSDNDLLQLTEKELLELPEEVVRRLSIKLLTDLKEARERLKQTSQNSSRPPSSDLPWNKVTDSDDEDVDRLAQDVIDKTNNLPIPTDKPSNNHPAKDQEQRPSNDEVDVKRKPGKQPGAAGYGRQQQIGITAESLHYPDACALCDKNLTQQLAKAYTAFETLDLIWSNPDEPGLKLTNTQHIYFERVCDACGHCTQCAPHRQPSHALTPSIELCQWRLVGPGLAALIVCLAYRMRLSRVRIKEFLSDWLAIQISVGTINATLHESGAAALPVEQELVEAIQTSGLLYVDETSWPELTQLLWLWVFCGQDVVAYWIATRSSELLIALLGSDYQGVLMSDGWHVYRHFLNRLRCWAHLLRKAKGLKESLDPNARLFGQQTLDLLNTLIDAVYAARKQPPNQALTLIYQQRLSAYQVACHAMSTSTHDKTRALAREMINDWDAIFQVLAHPHLPLTNNEAERALRHWVILRNICHGTRTENGTRIFAILISVIETCRVRQQSPWIYLAELIQQRRAGFPVPKLPLARVSE